MSGIRRSYVDQGSKKYLQKKINLLDINHPQGGHTHAWM
jgi:hypothetical protein